MGYRLEISKIKYSTCGGKLYGYTETDNLKSFKYLYNKGYLEGDEYWSYGCNPQIVLSATEFKEFIRLYIDDLKEYYHYGEDEKSEIIEDLIRLSKTKGDKLLEWG